ncbi:deoxynucleoside triphosphate triphosphohydrolase SAMHD1-like isoform X2 [Polypterus senegalus]|uniref:deoxynucleoside triphosphate triphosphohydrolase SAMHD1-like isoform X2 n=1 Tax=Polypterus senegalus TaxID=55291 RepID=UPI001965C053|nr:deoxynucleoside triphosphate triphosphohydrolase SAMHD1-like isoform X2 [Polypterus senegalus]
MEKYQTLTDNVYYEILFYKGEENDMKKAKEILQRIEKRQLYKMVTEVLLDQDGTGDQKLEELKQMAFDMFIFQDKKKLFKLKKHLTEKVPDMFVFQDKKEEIYKHLTEPFSDMLNSKDEKKSKEAKDYMKQVYEIFTHQDKKILEDMKNYLTEVSDTFIAQDKHKIEEIKKYLTDKISGVFIFQDEEKHNQLTEMISKINPEDIINTLEEIKRYLADEVSNMPTVQDKVKLDSLIKDLKKKASDMFIVQTFKIDCGKGMEDPIKDAGFYNLENPNVAVQIDRNQVSRMLPATFCEEVLRVYYKGKDLDTAKKIVKEWQKKYWR